MVLIEEKPLCHGISEDSLSSTNDTINTTTMSEEQVVQGYCKSKLRNRLFVGHYQDRRYVDSLSTYRDVVVIHNSEVDLKKDLDIIIKRLDAFYTNSMWIGCTGPQSGRSTADYAVWVKLHDVPFGHYWFRIKQIVFEGREIRLRVQVIRPLDLSDTAIPRSVKPSVSADEVEVNVSKTHSRSAASKESVETDWSDSVPTLEECAYSVAAWKDILIEKAAYFVVTVVTLHNLRETFRFLAALLVAAVTGLVQLVQFSGDFTIRFIHEFSVLVHAATPMMLGLIDFFTKMVGGLYILLAMMWRGNNNQPPSLKMTQSHHNLRRALPVEPSYADSHRR